MDPTRRRPALPGLVAAGLVVAALAVALIGRGLLTSAPSAAPGRPVPPGSAATIDAGDADDEGYAWWAVDRDGHPLRWDACSPVLFRLNPAEAPPSAERDVRRALALLADASGLRLELDSLTDERPHLDRPLVAREEDGWRWRPVLVAWAAPGEGDLPLTLADRGIALPVAVRDGDREAFVTGQVVLNAARTDLVPGFGDRRDAVGATLLHELIHLLGLDHVDDPDELMWSDPGTGPVRLGRGDRAGLRSIGAGAGCRPTPEAASGRGLDVQR